MEQKTKSQFSNLPVFREKAPSSFPSVAKTAGLPAFSKESVAIAKNLAPTSRVFANVVAAKEAEMVAAKEKEIVERIRKTVSVDVAICLDYTASTSDVVTSFRDQSSLLLRQLRSGGNSADMYPFAFSGPWSSASSGSKNDESWWKKLDNVTNGRCEPPIVESLRLLASKNPFAEKKSPGNFVVIATDEAFVKDAGYGESIEYLRKTNATVIAILSDNSSRIVRSYSETLASDLPGKVFTVENVSKSAEVAAGIIAGIREIYVEDQTKREMAKIRGDLKVELPKTPLLDRLAEKITAGTGLLRWNGETKLLK